MTYVSATYTHGGAGLFKQVLEKMLAVGWTIKEGIEDRKVASIPEEVATATALQTNGNSISVTITAMDVFLDLPVAMISNYTVQKNGAGGTLVENTDYVIDRDRGQIKALTGGAFSVSDNATIAASAYTIRQGWMVLASTGESGQEDILVGMRMVGTPCSTSGVFSGSAASPSRTGIQWCVFKQWTTGSGGSTWTVDQTRSVRNEITADVIMAVDPTDNVNQKYYLAVDKNRVLLYSSQSGGGEQAWIAIGALRRLHPVNEQSYVTFLMGNRSAVVGSESQGPVWDNNDPGNPGITNIGAVYLYDLGEFSGQTGGTITVDLNANHLQQEQGTANFPAPTSAGYFELHPVLVARSIGQGPSAVIQQQRVYGLVDGLMAVVLNSPSTEQVVTWQGEDYIIVGFSAAGFRFLAIRKT